MGPQAGRAAGSLGLSALGLTTGQDETVPAACPALHHTHLGPCRGLLGENVQSSGHHSLRHTPCHNRFSGKGQPAEPKAGCQHPRCPHAPVIQQVLTSLSALGPADGHMVHPSVTLQGGGGGRG